MHSDATHDDAALKPNIPLRGTESRLFKIAHVRLLLAGMGARVQPAGEDLPLGSIRGSSLFAALWMDISECEVFVDEGDRHAAFANAAGNALDGTVTNVAGAEDTGYAGFKRKRLAVK